MPNEQRGLCSYKPECLTCTKVVDQDKPTMCELINCEIYTPCPRCKQNRKLVDRGNGDKLCKHCMQGTEHAKKKIKTVASLQKEGIGIVDKKPVSSVNIKDVSITLPGEPPKELSEQEVEYYNLRWSDYKGYYRDPAAYFICHMIILLEINLTHLNGKLIITRGELHAEIMSEVSHQISMLKHLKTQLPEKESEEVMDDEKSLSWIYEAYVEATKARKIGKVSRMLSPSAIALAPSLEFPIDPKSLLVNMGYSLVEVDAVIGKIRQPPKNMSAEDVLRFFGFELDEEYAMTPDTPLVTEDVADLLEDALADGGEDG